MKLSHWARKHGMGYLTAWRWLRADILSSARRQLYERHLARNRAKRILEAMCG
jgi:predicted site-specific integrase-resolvase